MRKLTRKIHLQSFIRVTLFSAMVGFLSSCGPDDNEPKDDTAPDLSFTNLTENQGVWNTVPINLSVNDNTGVATVDVFVDGNIIKSFADAPYETSWDSNTASDGTHTIKAVVTDQSGNTTEKQLNVVVKNVLVNIDIASDQLYNNNGAVDHGYIFLSDETGKVIAFTEYANGQHIELKSPGFNGEIFYLTEVSADNNNSASAVSLATFAGIERGQKWAVWSNDGFYASMSSQQHETTNAGYAQLHFSGASSGELYEFFTAGSHGVVNQNITNYQTALSKSPAKLYVVRKTTNDPTPFNYGLYSNIEAGKTNQIDLSLATHDLKKVTITVPGSANAPQGFVNVTGYPDASNHDEPYKLGSFVQSSNGIDVYYPYDAFASYYVRSDYYTESMYYLRGVYNEFSHVVPQHAVNFSFENNKLTYSASGDFDLIGAVYSMPDQDGEWILMLPSASSLSVPLLEIPEQLQGLRNSIPVLGTTPQAYRIFEFDGITDYQGVKTFISNSTHSINELESNNKIFIDVTLRNESAEGRIRNSISRRRLEDRLQRR